MPVTVTIPAFRKSGIDSIIPLRYIELNIKPIKGEIGQSRSFINKGVLETQTFFFLIQSRSESCDAILYHRPSLRLDPFNIGIRALPASATGVGSDSISKGNVA